ncbi:beta-propeller domain-containing protein [Mesobacillus subterraneus]|uniref:beta-propeller domain-containing protein n=1 Tax=Mesobacillus subterraneus TaxID=285983 RepID=UPI00203ECCF7|nr:beta-propeller domain-containing protein [Mesobacillus subterraneus]MCM3665105.1 beta-propeller domain-containing protein [Mesobacillus subterraneus]MCM3684118.1 beta-propeller domain-containing protein [Mesobacillus subterraneus]
MMKKWWVLSGLLLISIVGLAFYSIPQFKVVNAWEGEEIVLPNKVWKLQFSEKISEKSLDNNFIYITDDKGEKLQTELELSDDQKTIYINPPENGYDLKSKQYTVHFKKGIKSALGRELNSSYAWEFVVKETLPVVGSQEKLAGYFEGILKEQEKSRGWFGGLKESISEDTAMEDSSSANKSAGGGDVSETNVQVQGVDEADIVKTDGQTIFQAEQNKVRIIQAVPGAQMKLLSMIPYDETFSPYQLFLEDEKLVVIGQQYHNFSKPYDKIAKDSLIAPMTQSTKVIVYNVKNPAKPAQIREIELEGGYVSGRKVDNQVYLITQHYPDFWLLKENREIDIRPKYFDSASETKEKKISYDDIRYFPESREPNYTMIAAFDLNLPKKEAAITTYLGSGNQIYMSKENLYLAVQNQGDLAMEERGVIASDTDIHKFAINGMDVKYHSSATVPGTVLNQFSMDEHDGFFRLVTTKGYAWDETKPSSNHLYILDKNLKEAGKIEGLARGERIYSARFMGDRIYMVTFKETDPLFVIEASDPRNPKVLGELKIPGFSNYLHPYDENQIIGFGQDTKIVAEKGSSQPRILTDGVKISLFDVSDMSNPEEKFTEIIGGRGTYSPLNHDHKALLFNKNKNLFAFPISVYRNSDKNEYEQIFEYQGAYIYNIDPAKGITLKSKITHIDGKMPYYEEWESQIQRLLYIGDTLYALSPAKITSHNMKTYEKIGELGLGLGGKE